MSYPTETASRTRYTLLVVLSVVTGVYAHFTYGQWAGLWGFAAGAVAALMIGWLIAQVVERRGRRL